MMTTLDLGLDQPFILYDKEDHFFHSDFQINAKTGLVDGHEDHCVLLPRVGYDRTMTPIYLGSILHFGSDQSEPMVVGQIGFNFMGIAKNQSWFCPLDDHEDLKLCSKPLLENGTVTGHYYDTEKHDTSSIRNHFILSLKKE